MAPNGEGGEQGPQLVPAGLLDLTDEPPGPPPGTLLDLRDVEQQREEMRGIIAVALVVLFSVVVLSALGAVIFGTSADDMKSILEVVLPPIVALTGTAVGFYFGGK